MFSLLDFKASLLQKKYKMLHTLCINGTESGILLYPFGKYLFTLPLWSCHIFRLFTVFSRSDMKSIFFTEFVGNRLKFVFPIFLMALKLISRHHIYTVYNNMGMKMITICMNSYYRFILSVKCILCKSHGDIIHNLRRTFPRF